MEEEGRNRRRKKMKMGAKRKTGSTYIPMDVLVDILSRLPARLVWSLRSVCKDWQSLIQSPSFADLQLSRSKDDICLLLWGYQTNHRYIFKTRFYSINKDGKAVKVVSQELVHPVMTTTSSINGLICYCRYDPDSDPHIEIFNPVTNQLITLPQPNFSLSCSPKLHLIEIGFDSTTKTYKLLAFKDAHPNPPEVEIFTLGETNTNSNWRKVEDVPPLEINRLHDRTYADGRIYWFTSEYYHPHADGSMICSLTVFNFAQEKFEFVPFPPDIDILNFDYWMGEVGGGLCFVEAKRIKDRNIVKLRKLTNSGTRQLWVDQVIAMPLFKEIYAAFPVSTGVMMVHRYKKKLREQYICFYNEQGQVVNSIQVHGIPQGLLPRRVHSESLVSLTSILPPEL